MDLTDPSHRAYIKSIYKGHQGGSAKGFKKFYEAQSLWMKAWQKPFLILRSLREKKDRIGFSLEVAI